MSPTHKNACRFADGVLYFQIGNFFLISDILAQVRKFLSECPDDERETWVALAGALGHKDAEIQAKPEHQRTIGDSIVSFFVPASSTTVRRRLAIRAKAALDATDRIHLAFLVTWDNLARAFAASARRVRVKVTR